MRCSRQSLDVRQSCIPPRAPQGLSPSKLGGGITTSRVYFFEDNKETTISNALSQEEGISGHPRSSIVALAMIS